MKILFAASEVAPFIKTGGLADVVGSLPRELVKRGHEVRVILPLYEKIGQNWRDQMTYLTNFGVTLGWRNAYCGLFQLEMDGVTYLFVDNEYYFKRASIYGHYDDGERFGFFSRSVLEACCQLGWFPDVIHSNDWETALVPVYLLEADRIAPPLMGTKSVFTIHNIEYQGRYGEDTLEDLFGLDQGFFNERCLAYHGDVNLMKGAIYASDYVTTVSPTYAEQLRDPFYAHGMEGVIADNSYKMRGILNGIPLEEYDPWKDKRLVKRFSAGRPQGKKECKAALQQILGLNEFPDVPIVSCVSRLVPHKGFNMVLDAIHDIMGLNVQMVVLGSGDWKYEQAFQHVESQYPGRFAARLYYSEELASSIYAGADLFLMPSVSEPCGIGQMIAMRYGTVPVVRETGGLRDTVEPYNKIEGTGTGFSFAPISAHDMLWVLREAVDVYCSDKDAWKGIVKRAMQAKFDWSRSADEYCEIYQQITGGSH